MPTTVKISIGLVAVVALFWLGLGLLAINNQYVKISIPEMRLVFGILAIGCSLSLAAAAWLLTRRNRITYFGATILLGLILIASFMDDLGMVDFLLIAITAIALGLLIKERAWFMQK